MYSPRRDADACYPVSRGAAESRAGLNGSHCRRVGNARARFRAIVPPSITRRLVATVSGLFFFLQQVRCSHSDFENKFFSFQTWSVEKENNRWLSFPVEVVLCCALILYSYEFTIYVDTNEGIMTEEIFELYRELEFSFIQNRTLNFRCVESTFLRLLLRA